MSQTRKTESALSLAARGFAVFPVRPNGKEPFIKGWQVHATNDPEKIRAVWDDPTHPEFNIGISTGALLHGNRFFALDVDTKNGKRGDESLATLEAIHDELPATLTFLTPSGGEHRVFFADGPVPCSVSKIASGLDIRGEGGLIVAPGSSVDGREYRILHDREIAHAPRWLIDLTRAAVAPRPACKSPLDVTLDIPQNVERAVDYLVNRADEAIEGNGGDNATIRVINQLGDLAISQEAACDLLAEHWNETKAIPPWDLDDLRRKVASAYKSRQNPVGVASAEAEFDAVEPDHKTALTLDQTFASYSWDEARPDLDRPFLIDDLMDRGAMVVTYGDSNVGKTYVVLDQCVAIASGSEWNGHKTACGLVVYVAAEGGRGFMKRVEAYRRGRDVRGIPLSIIPSPLDLMSNRVDTRRLVNTIRVEEAKTGRQCVLVVVDTLARAMGNGDENTAADMGALIKNCDEIRAKIGSTVNVIHHTGKDKSKGARGSSALRAATDTEIEIDQGRLTVTKQRDMERAREMCFALRPVEIGHRADGRVVTACVVDWTPAAEVEFEDRRLSAGEEEVFAALKRCRDRQLAEGKTAAVRFTDWMVGCVPNLPPGSKGKDVPDAKKQLLVRAMPTLIQQKLIAKTQRGQYVIVGDT